MKESLESTEPGSSQFKRVAVTCFALAFAIVVLWGGVGNMIRPFSQRAQNAATVDAQKNLLFFAAVENQMKAPFIYQNGSQLLDPSAESKGKLVLEATSDFSDPSSPKTKLDYKVESADAAIAGASARSLAIIGTDVYAMIPEGATEPYVSGQWYHIPADTSDPHGTLDVFNVGKEVNTSLGVILTGQFTDEQRKEFMEFIRTNTVYTVRRTGQEDIDGKSTTRYEVRVNTAKIKELNSKAAKTLSVTDVLANTSDNAPRIEKFNTWIDADQRFKKIVFEQHYPKTDMKAESTFTFDYPTESPNITPPDGAIKLE